MSRIGLITNPNSGPKHGARESAALVDTAARHLIPAVATQTEDDIVDALASFARAGVDVLAVHGGDGTVDSVLTVLRNNDPFKTEPVLALIPGGTTNMTHADVGLRRKGAKALDHLARQCQDGLPWDRVVERRPARISRDDGHIPFYGFFIATAAIPRVIRATRSRLHNRGLTGWRSEALALLWSLWRLLGGRVHEDPVMHPDTLAYALDDGDWQDVQAVILLATTLERLILGLRPAPPEGSLGVAALTWPYRRLTARLPGFLRGRQDSGDLTRDLGRSTATRLRLRLSCEYTVDGELFPPPRGGELELTAAEPARFLVL